MLSFTNIKIIQHRTLAYILSAVIILSGIINVAVHRGLKMGIDFAGGNMIQVAFEDRTLEIGKIRDVLIGTGYGNNVQKIDDPGKNVFILRTLALERDNDKVIAHIEGALVEEFGEENVLVERTDIVGPRISKDLLRTSYIVGVVAIALILFYITFRFRLRFGIAAIIALVHDVIVVMSFISFFGKEMDTFILAAILTIIGYSLNDTIVVFDRVRENLKSSKAYEDYEQTVNRSINQSLSRTVITSVTTLLVLVSLFIFGGNTLKNFAFALIIGVVVGTYSSMFIASALLVEWHRWKPEKLKKV
jgi:preprotein translocase subunit SecF